MVELSKIQNLLAMVCPREPEEILPNHYLVQDLEMDSFGVMEMVMEFETEFGIEIPDRDLRLFNTVQDIMNYLEERTSKSGSLAGVL